MITVNNVCLFSSILKALVRLSIHTIKRQEWNPIQKKKKSMPILSYVFASNTFPSAIDSMYHGIPFLCFLELSSVIKHLITLDLPICFNIDRIVQIWPIFQHKIIINKLSCLHRNTCIKIQKFKLDSKIKQRHEHDDRRQRGRERNDDLLNTNSISYTPSNYNVIKITETDIANISKQPEQKLQTVKQNMIGSIKRR